MQFNWEDIGVIAGLLAAGFTIVSYTVRTAELGLRQEVSELKRRLDRMDAILDRIADFTSQLAVLNERFLAQGKRQDEVDRRMNDMASRLTKVSDRHTGQDGR